MIQLISSHPELQTDASVYLFKVTRDENVIYAQPLLQIAFWCVGEFGDLLINGNNNDENFSVKVIFIENFFKIFQIHENEVIDVFEQLMPSSLMTISTREYGLTALAKLLTRFDSGGDRIQALICRYSSHMNLELQQRAIEYSRLLLKDDLK